MRDQRIYDRLCGILTDYETEHNDLLKLYSDIVELVNEILESEG